MYDKHYSIIIYYSYYRILKISQVLLDVVIGYDNRTPLLNHQSPRISKS